MTTADAATAAFERFFLDVHPKLVALGLAWSGDRDVARDLAQEALVRAYDRWDVVSGYDAPGAWVRRVMVNLLVDRGRRERRTTNLLQRLRADEAFEPPTPGGDEWWRAVRALPDQQRAAVTLHYLEDLPIAEVATILEIAPGTVKSTLSHARQKLRAALSVQEDRG